MFDKLSENLDLLMTEVRISADELSRRTGVPPSTIKKIRNRYNPNPTLTTLLPLAEFFAITLGQLVGNEPLPEVRLKGPHKKNIETLHHVSLLSWEESITWPMVRPRSHQTVTTEHAYSNDVFALVVTEDNWEHFSQGTVLMIDPIFKPEHKDFALVYKEGQKIPSLRQIFYDEGQLYLKPIVPGYKIAIFTSEHKLLGVVVEYKKHLKGNRAKMNKMEN